jgi:hypothetical protein
VPRKTTAPYDHHEKAGNEGDVVKHVALIAALRAVVGEAKGSEFAYADTFAAYVSCPPTSCRQTARKFRKRQPELRGAAGRL